VFEATKRVCETYDALILSARRKFETERTEFRIDINSTGAIVPSVTSDDIDKAAPEIGEPIAQSENGAAVAPEIPEPDPCTTPSANEQPSRSEHHNAVEDSVEDGRRPNPKAKDIHGSSVRTTDTRFEPELAANDPAVAPDPRDTDRGKARSAWLDARRGEKKWSSDLDIEKRDGPTYNTIQRYRSGKKSTRDAYVRQKFADLFGCELEKVPK
jgi:hypothetical protein